MTGNGALELKVAGNKAADEAGNKNDVTTQTIAGIVVDNTPPIISSPAEGTYTKVNVTPVYSDTNYSHATVSLDSGEDEEYEGEEITAEGIYVLTVYDKAGNSSNVTFTIDKTLPTVQVTKAAGTVYVNSTGTVNLDVTFADEYLVDAELVEGNITVKVGASTVSPSITVGAPTGANPKTYPVEITGLTGNGILEVTIAAGLAEDEADNKNASKTQGFADIIVDNTKPEVTMTKNIGSGSFINTAGDKGTAKIDVTFTDTYLKTTDLQIADILEVKVGGAVVIPGISVSSVSRNRKYQNLYSNTNRINRKWSIGVKSSRSQSSR